MISNASNGDLPGNPRMNPRLKLAVSAGSYFHPTIEARPAKPEQANKGFGSETLSRRQHWTRYYPHDGAAFLNHRVVTVTGPGG
jgi:hypothetical protein